MFPLIVLAGLAVAGIGMLIDGPKKTVDKPVEGVQPPEPSAAKSVPTEFVPPSPSE